MKRLQTTIKGIENYLRKLGFYSIEEEASNHEYDYSLFQKNKIESENPDADKHIIRVRMDCHNLHHCCGIVELGDLSIYPLLRSNTSSTNIEVRQLFIQWLFLKVKLLGYSPKQREDKIPVVTKLLFASNGIRECKEVETALLALPKEFTSTSITRNPSSNSLITLFIARY